MIDPGPRSPFLTPPSAGGGLRLLLAALLLFGLAAGRLAAQTHTIGGRNVPQLTRDGRVYVDARATADALGLSYHWFPLQRMVIISRGTQMLRLMVNKDDAVFQNEKVQLGYAPIYHDGRPWIPPADVARVFGVSSGGSGAGSGGRPGPIPASPDNAAALAVPPPSRPATSAVPPPPPPPVPPPGVIPGPGSAQIVPPPAVTVAPEPQPIPIPAEGVRLLDVRHSIRDTETRIVLEFSGPTRHIPSQPTPTTWRLTMPDCQPTMPTRRLNPPTRDLKSMAINSGVDRRGLVFTFERHPGTEMPRYSELSGQTWRLLVEFPLNRNAATATAQVASPSAALASPSQALVASAAAKVAGVGSGVASGSATAAASVPVAVVAPAEAIIEVTREVVAASLTQEIFRGRKVVIDAGHGGNDVGAVYKDLVQEKQVTLGVALQLERALKARGLTPVLVRNTDRDMSASERLARIQKAGGDLLISLHVGASQDPGRSGPSCLPYENAGVAFEVQTAARLSPALVYNDWCKMSRFDLARFLARSIEGRLIGDLEVVVRKIGGLPLAPLRFASPPGVVVELGMISNSEEARRLGSKGMQRAQAEAIANGVVDFFNALQPGEGN